MRQEALRFRLSNPLVETLVNLSPLNPVSLNKLISYVLGISVVPHRANPSMPVPGLDEKLDDWVDKRVMTTMGDQWEVSKS